jgi:hypothetical protein
VIAAEVVAEDAPGTVDWLTQHMPAALTRSGARALDPSHI